MRARLKFQKTGALKFISHLDVMRTVQKAFRRAGLAVSYSKGFSPHQLLSFASPLGIGLTSDGEYLDAQFDCTYQGEEVLSRLNAVLPEELQFTGFLPLSLECKPSMALVAAARYLLGLREDVSVSSVPEGLTEILEELYARESLVLEITSKSGSRQMDIRPYWYDFHCAKREDYAGSGADCLESPLLFEFLLSSGSVVNVKPEVLLTAAYEALSLPFPAYDWQIHRMDLYGRREDGSFYSLGEGSSA